MRKSNTLPLGEILREYLKVNALDKRLDEMRLVGSWPEVVGKTVASKTTRLVVKNRVLFVYLNSSVVRSEMLRIRESLPSALNRKAGQNIIDEVIIR